ncbi:MAG TPA: hypothetical protein VJS63_15525 [Bradyrhizobium sp.]|nr:hypothetical protein [Bradyrhizobium sp.]
MRELEELVRDQISRDLDCSEAASAQLSARREIVRLIEEWKAAGGGDRLPSPSGPRMGKGKLARLGSASASASASGLGVLPAGARNPAQRGGRSVA